MQRAPFVIAGTVVGVAAVLAYPTHRLRLVIPSQGAPGRATQPASRPPASQPPAGPPGATATSVPAASPSGERQATGADTPYPYGDLAVRVTVTGSRITGIAVARIQETDGRSVMIDQQAIPMLRQQVLAAQSTNIDGVSGATYTSQAYVDSVQSALDRLGVR